MKNKILKCLVFAIIASGNSCTNKDNHSAEIIQKLEELKAENQRLKEDVAEINTGNSNNENIQNEQPTNSDNRPKADISNNKQIYAFVVITVSVPELEYSSGLEPGLENGHFKTTWDEISFTSKIHEIKDYNEDKKFKFIDQMTDELQPTLNEKNMNYYLSISQPGTVGDIAKYESIRRKLSKNECKIIERKCFTFATYKEAGLSRDKYILN